MELAVIGLGRMGSNIARRLMRAGHGVVAHDSDAALVESLVAEGATGALTMDDVAAKLHAPRVVWVMLPAGDPTRTALAALRQRLSPLDTVVDGGNSDWREDAARAESFAAGGIAYVDVGVSGGLFGLADGWCLMVGGELAPVERLRQVFEALAAPHGFAHLGKTGSGHYAKMVHNAIEYGVMESLAEGFDLLHGAPQGLDSTQIANLWRHGSVIRGWLLDLTHATLKRDPKLEAVAAAMPDTGEGRWALETAIAQESPCTVLAASLFSRFRSRQPDNFATRLQTALRREFTGHGAPPAQSPPRAGA